MLLLFLQIFTLFQQRVKPTQPLKPAAFVPIHPIHLRYHKTQDEGITMKTITMLGAAGLVLALGGCKSVSLAEAPQAPVAMNPLVERIENMTATGYAVISVQNHRQPAQQRLMAIRASKLDAYRSLTEQIYGLQLDASATVADMAVTSDNFRSKVQGVVYGATLVSITPVGDDTYETTLSIDKHMVQELRRQYLAMLAQRAR